MIVPLVNEVNAARMAAGVVAPAWETYTVTFLRADGEGEVMEPQIFTNGISQALRSVPWNPPVPGDSFVGWWQWGNGLSYTNCQTIMVSRDMKLYARWASEYYGGGGSGEGGGTVTPDPVTPVPETPGYEAIVQSDIREAFVVPKAVTLQGSAYDGNGAVVGIVELKLGKVSKGKGKVSGSFTGLDGKKITLKAVPVTGIDGAKPEAVSLDVKDLGTMNVTIGGGQFAGSLGGRHVQSATVGGHWTGRGATVAVDADDLSMFAGRVLSELLPDGEEATVNNGKWAFSKAAGVKWAKPKSDAFRSEYYDATSGKDLIVDDTKGKTNLSGLKLTYAPKKGTFKGSFKVYALEGAGKARKLKKYTVNVSGVVVGGVGYGTATCKKPAASWPVTVW